MHGPGAKAVAALLCGCLSMLSPPAAARTDAVAGVETPAIPDISWESVRGQAIEVLTSHAGRVRGTLIGHDAEFIVLALDDGRVVHYGKSGLSELRRLGVGSPSVRSHESGVAPKPPKVAGDASGRAAKARSTPRAKLDRRVRAEHRRLRRKGLGYLISGAGLGVASMMLGAVAGGLAASYSIDKEFYDPCTGNEGPFETCDPINEGPDSRPLAVVGSLAGVMFFAAILNIAIGSHRLRRAKRRAAEGPQARLWPGGRGFAAQIRF